MAILTTSRKNLKGSSLLEIILAISLLTMIVTGIVSAIVFGRYTAAENEKRIRANQYAKEGLSVISNIKDADFADLIDGTHGLQIVGNEWQLSGGSDTQDVFTREVTIATVDAQTKSIEVDVSWLKLLGGTNSQIVLESNLTDWRTANTTPGDPPWTTPINEATVDLAGIANGLKIQVVGSYAYITRQNDIHELTVIDISTPSSPSQVGSADLTSNTNNIAVAGNYAYLSGTNNALEVQIVDISTPTAPVSVASYNRTGTTNARDLVVSGNYLYLGADSSGDPELEVIDISTPTSPTLAGSLELAERVRGMYIDGSYLYIASDHNSQELQVIDISTPTAPSLIGSLNLAGNNNGNSVVVSGSYAYLARRNGNFYVVDISNPAAPTEVSSIALGGRAEDLSYNAGLVFAGTQNAALEFQAIDVSTPATPVVRGGLDAGNDIFGVWYDSASDRVYGVGTSNTEEFYVYAPE